jgi:ATP-dependent Clp protease ATP-binding subunit ClpC
LRPGTIILVFERFTDEARRCVVYAQEEARSLNSPVIDGAHLLLGIARCEGVATAVLSRIGVTAETLRERYAGLNAPTDETYGGHIPFTPTAKHALESALREALTLGHAHIGAEHILLGLAREADSGVTLMLSELGTDTAALRTAVLEQLSGQHPQSRDSREPRGSRDDRQGRNDPVLEQFGTNLTALAAEGKLDAMIGRERELERVIQILSRRTKNNPCLVGEPGVGKTAIVEGLARAIHAGLVPDTIAGCEVWTLDIGSLVAGARYRGDFEERMKKVVKEVSSRDDVILFLDELHTVIGAGSSEGALDAANLLKPALARGEVRVVGATTYDEYRKHVEKDPALERRFQQVKVEEPSRELTVEILSGVRDVFAEHHGVEITNDAISTAVELAARYVTDRFFPDKAVDLIDEAGAYLRIHPDLPRVLDADVVSIVCEHATGIPIRRNEAESARLLSMETDLQARVVGQPFALAALAKSIRRSRAGLRDLRRPVGSFLFLGPTGVGKTETAKALAELLFGDETAMISIDMSEYQEKHTVSRLIGAPPGYVGHDEPGQLTEAVRRKPYSVVLLDEVEKAHPDVFNVLLQLLEEGRLTDATGRQVDFSNCVVIATSNLGSSEFQRASVGFSISAKDTSHRELQRTAEEAARKFFRPELLNRIDEVIVFNQLSSGDVEEIAELFIDQLAGRLAERSVSLTVSQAALVLLSKTGFDQTLGARPLRRAVQRLVEDPLAEKMLQGHLRPGSHVLVEELAGELVFVVEQHDNTSLAAISQSL